jgi:hypothetical protein
MKPAWKFVSAVRAVALVVGLALPTVVFAQLAFVQAAYAAVVSSIDVQGNQRVDDETIINYIGIRPGRPFNSVDIDEGVKRLFGTGLFADVQINQRGTVLVVIVDEYMIVNQVLFQGNKKIKDAELAGAVQLQPRGTFSTATMEADAQTIREKYSAIGRDDAIVNPQVMELGETRVNVVFEINEGGRTKRRCGGSTTIAVMPTSRSFRPSANWTSRPTSTRSPSRSRKASAIASALSASRTALVASIRRHLIASSKPTRATSTTPRRSRTRSSR